MLPRNKALLSFSILVFLIAGIYFFTDWFSKTTGYVLGEDEKVRLAQCLKENGATLYISSSCFDCDEQVALFGETAVGFLEIKECNKVENCPDLLGVPAWRIGEEYYYGKKELKEIIDISGCIVS